MPAVHKQTTAPVRVGGIVTRAPVTLNEADPHSKRRPPMRGRVVWVHPLGRFHVVEFGEGGQAIRECFAGIRAEGTG